MKQKVIEIEREYDDLETEAFFAGERTGQFGVCPDTLLRILAGYKSSDKEFWAFVSNVDIIRQNIITLFWKNPLIFSKYLVYCLGVLYIRKICAVIF